MSQFLCKTRPGESPGNKPRVYFTCHPADFTPYFQRVCDDIFKTHSCAIYYKERLDLPVDAENKETDLGQMNLFVVPVSRALLTEPNYAMAEDVAFARAKHIPILPLMMEVGIDALYGRRESFGKMQYLEPDSRDETGISYEEKLRRYLDTVLISDETARRIRAAFDAYIFLSYRKKDRRYANELMRMIHRNPACRDIAIWYDEFLTPGESFEENIRQALERSELFALLITPNLLEEPGGRPNFVMEHEYPAAQRFGKEILPAEMAPTDRAALSAKFAHLPAPVSPADEESFRQRLLQAVSRIARSENDGNPEHTFLIGLAYLEGIDVERDIGRAVELVEGAAEAGLEEAMEKMYHMYCNGEGVKKSIRAARSWAERLLAHCTATYGEVHPKTFEALKKVNRMTNMGEHRHSVEEHLELCRKLYDIACKLWGEEHREAIDAVISLAGAYRYVGDMQASIACRERYCEIKKRMLGEGHPDLCYALQDLAMEYYQIQEYDRALELQQKLYENDCKAFGEADARTLSSLGKLMAIYDCLGNKEKVEELQRRISGIRGEALEEDADMAGLLSSMATIYRTIALRSTGREKLEGQRKSLELDEQAYAILVQTYGEESSKAGWKLHQIAIGYHSIGEHKAAVPLLQKVYEQEVAEVGVGGALPRITLETLGMSYEELGEYEKALEVYERIHCWKCQKYGEDHYQTLITAERIEACREKLAKVQALEADEK